MLVRLYNWTVSFLNREILIWRAELNVKAESRAITRNRKWVRSTAMILKPIGAIAHFPKIIVVYNYIPFKINYNCVASKC